MDLRQRPPAASPSAKEICAVLWWQLPAVMTSTLRLPGNSRYQVTRNITIIIRYCLSTTKSRAYQKSGAPDGDCIGNEYCDATAIPFHQSPVRRGAVKARGSSNSGNGLFALLLVNIAVFMLQQAGQQAWVSALYLNHQQPHWWQFLTNSFCHANWAHLSSNMFGLYVFGRSVEEDEGGGAVWLTYIVCALGAAPATPSRGYPDPLAQQITRSLVGIRKWILVVYLLCLIGNDVSMCWPATGSHNSNCHLQLNCKEIKDLKALWSQLH